MLQIQSVNNRTSQEYSKMVGSEGVGLPLVKSGDFAADYLLFGVGQKTTLHTHEGDHILIVHYGSGWLNYGSELHCLEKGTCYFVPGQTPHRITAGINGLGLFSVANKHRPVNSAERLDILED